MMNTIVIYFGDSRVKAQYKGVIHIHIASTTWGERVIQITCQEGEEANTYEEKLQRDEFIGVW